MGRVLALVLLVAANTDAFHSPMRMQRLRPSLARPAVVSMSYEAVQPPDQNRLGKGPLLLSAGGLLTTILASASVLPALGTIAIIAAASSGLFAFKLSKEMNQRGIKSKNVAKRVVGTCADVTVRVGLGLASVVVYTLAATVSLIVLLLTKLGQAVLSIAEAASRLKPTLPEEQSAYDTEQQRRLAAEYSAMQQQRYASEYAAPQPEGYYAAAPAAQPAAQPYAAPPPQPVYERPPPSEDQESARSMGQRLAVEQMLVRSRGAAAVARKVESEKAALLKTRQQEAGKQIIEARRKAQAEGRAADWRNKPEAISVPRGGPVGGPAPAKPPPDAKFFEYKSPAGAAARPPPVAMPKPPPPAAPPPSTSGSSLASAARQQSGFGRAPSNLPPRAVQPKDSKLDVSLAQASRASPPPAAAPKNPSAWLPRGATIPTKFAPPGQPVAKPPAPPPAAASPAPPPKAKEVAPLEPKLTVAEAKAQVKSAGAQSAASQWLPRGVKLGGKDGSAKK